MDQWLFFIVMYCETIVFVSPEWPPSADSKCNTDVCVCVCDENMLVVVIEKKDEQRQKCVETRDLAESANMFK